MSSSYSFPSDKAGSSESSISSPKRQIGDGRAFELKSSNNVNDPAIFGSPPVNELFMGNLEKRMEVYFAKK